MARTLRPVEVLGPARLVGLITLDPFVRTTTGIGARIPGWPFDWMAERIGEMRSHDAAANAISQAVNDTFGSNADANESSDPARGSNNGSSTTDTPAPSDDPPRAAGR